MYKYWICSTNLRDADLCDTWFWFGHDGAYTSFWLLRFTPYLGMMQLYVVFPWSIPATVVVGLCLPMCVCSADVCKRDVHNKHWGWKTGWRDAEGTWWASMESHSQHIQSTMSLWLLMNRLCCSWNFHWLPVIGGWHPRSWCTWLNWIVHLADLLRHKLSEANAKQNATNSQLDESARLSEQAQEQVKEQALKLGDLEAMWAAECRRAEDLEAELSKQKSALLEAQNEVLCLKKDAAAKVLAYGLRLSIAAVFLPQKWALLSFFVMEPWHVTCCAL